LYHYFPTKQALLDDKCLDLENHLTRLRTQCVWLVLARHSLRVSLD
jgi:hypothetical protein